MGDPAVEHLIDLVMYSVVAYVCSEVPGGVVAGLMAWRRWPAAFSTIAPLFALASAVAGALAAVVTRRPDETLQAIVPGLAIFGLLAAAASLPVSLTYCLIAGAPWTPPRLAPADPATFD